MSFDIDSRIEMICLNDGRFWKKRSRNYHETRGMIEEKVQATREGSDFLCKTSGLPGARSHSLYPQLVIHGDRRIDWFFFFFYHAASGWDNKYLFVCTERGMESYFEVWPRAPSLKMYLCGRPGQSTLLLFTAKVSLLFWIYKMCVGRQYLFTIPLELIKHLKSVGLKKTKKT